MITPSLRIKVTDFLATDYEQKVFQELMKIKQLPEFEGVHFPLYFWYDREFLHHQLSTLLLDLQMIKLKCLSIKYNLILLLFEKKKGQYLILYVGSFKYLVPQS